MSITLLCWIHFQFSVMHREIRCYINLVLPLHTVWKLLKSLIFTNLLQNNYLQSEFWRKICKLWIIIFNIAKWDFLEDFETLWYVIKERWRNTFFPFRNILFKLPKFLSNNLLKSIVHFLSPPPSECPVGNCIAYFFVTASWFF